MTWPDDRPPETEVISLTATMIRNVRREPEPEPQPPQPPEPAPPGPPSPVPRPPSRRSRSRIRSRNRCRRRNRTPRPHLPPGAAEGPEPGFAAHERLGYRIHVLLDIDIRLRPDVRSPAEARRSLEALRPSLDDHLVDDAVLLVSEIVSNSVRHAGLDRERCDPGADPGIQLDASRRRGRSGSGVRSGRLPVPQDEWWVGASAARPALEQVGCRAEPRDAGLVRAHVAGFHLHRIGYVNNNRDAGGVPWVRTRTRPRVT